MHVEIYNYCRACGEDLEEIFKFGKQFIQGSFIVKGGNNVSKRKIENTICKCKKCHLVQNRCSVPPEILYSSYFYQSGISKTMTDHLRDIATRCYSFFDEGQQAVLDIGSNDGTFLKFFPKNFVKLGVDPSDIALKSAKENPELIIYNECFPSQKIDLSQISCTASLGCFYDTNDPVSFAFNVGKLLSDSGVWVAEFAYLPLVLKNLTFDGMVMEHVAIYSLATFEYVLKLAGLKVFKAEVNDVNGGSLLCFVCKNDCSLYDTEQNKKDLLNLRIQEFDLKLDEMPIYEDFAKKVTNYCWQIKKLVLDLVEQGKKIHIYGMSTKGNNLLGIAEIGPDLIPFAAERDERKWGGQTLDGIKMISEEESRKTADVYFVGPYHFISEIVAREQLWIKNGGTMIFPLPEITVVNKDNFNQYLK